MPACAQGPRNRRAALVATLTPYREKGHGRAGKCWCIVGTFIYWNMITIAQTPCSLRKGVTIVKQPTVALVLGTKKRFALHWGDTLATFPVIHRKPTTLFHRERTTLPKLHLALVLGAASTGIRSLVSGCPCGSRQLTVSATVRAVHTPNFMAYKNVMVIGARKTGKTSLLSAALNGHFDELYGRECPCPPM